MTRLLVAGGSAGLAEVWPGVSLSQNLTIACIYSILKHGNYFDRDSSASFDYALRQAQGKLRTGCYARSE
jgi:hypothetical protein